MRTGKIVVGSVLDCNKKYLERALKDYDKQLYIKWNPEKDKGMGMWEIRRKPEFLSAVPRWEYNGQVVFDMQYKELDLVHHVLDLPALNYDCLNRIKEMDVWKYKSFADQLEYEEDTMRSKALDKNKAELKYRIKQYRKVFADVKEEVMSGRNPADFLLGEW